MFPLSRIYSLNTTEIDENILVLYKRVLLFLTISPVTGKVGFDINMFFCV